MVRTQIYLTEEEQAALRDLSMRTGKSKSDLIRKAVEYFISRFHPKDRKALLVGAKGMWAGRTDLPDFRSLRREVDRTRGKE